MKFIIICPPTSVSSTTKTTVPPFGALFLADSLLRKEWQVSILDDGMESIFDSLKQEITSETVAIGISSMSGVQLGNALKIAEFLKINYSDIPLIWGGAHATALPIQTLKSKFVDYVVWGEGEESLPQLLEAIQGKRDIVKIKGIGWKKNKELFISENIGYTSLNRIFNLPYYLVNMKKYARKLNIGVSRALPVWTSRGCPFRCKFCSNSSSTWPNTQIRYHTIEHIITNISKLIDKYSADCISFTDENFIFSEKRLHNICNAINQSGFNVKFRCSGRIDLLSKLSEETWRLMKKTGFIAMGTGVESGSQRILNLIGKKITLDQIYDVDRKLTKYGFFKGYNIMIGVPGETKEDLRQTLRLVVNLAKTSKYCPYPFGTLYKYIPLPCTELFNEVIKCGFKPPREIFGWVKFDTNNIENYRIINQSWLSVDHWPFIKKTSELIEKLNRLYVGKLANIDKIDKAIKKIEIFLEQN